MLSDQETETPNVMDRNNYRAFWVKWESGKRMTAKEIHVIGNSRFLDWVLIMRKGCSRILPSENGMVPLDSGISHLSKDQGILCVTIYNLAILYRTSHATF